WQPLLYSGNASGLTGDLVFCGYGVESKEHGYDDYEGVDLKGKIAVVFTRGPKSDKGGSFGVEHLTLVEDLRFKVSLAKNHGAAGVCIVRAEGDGWLELGYGDPGVPVVQLRRDPFLELFKSGGSDLEALRGEIDAKLAPHSKAMTRGAGKD